MGGQAQQRMGQSRVGVGEAGAEGSVVEADGSGHGYVRPLNRANVRSSSSHRNLRGFLHVLLQLLHVSLKLGSSVLEPANNLKINVAEIEIDFLFCCSIGSGIDVLKILTVL